MNGRGKTRPYTMDDYIKDREQGWGKTENTAAQTLRKPAGGFSVAKFNPHQPMIPSNLKAQSQAMARRNQATGTVTTPPVEAPSVNVGSGAPEGGTVGAVPLTDVDVYKYQMDQARQKVYDVLNRKFKYNAKDSPLYTIMQQQYEREAERAAGRAYSSAVANTGGYGSSYATLAGEEARRQVMEGMDEAQYELYQAARQEFMDERQSAVDWYSQARQMYLDKLSDEEYRKQLEAEAGKTMSDSTYQLLIEASTNGWYKGDNENLLRAKLETYKAGDPSIDVDAIMGHLEREYDAWQADTEEGDEEGIDLDDPRVLEANNYLQTTYGTAYSEGAMMQDLLSKGYPEEVAKVALESQRKFASSVTTDYTASSISDAITNADVLRSAFANKQLTAEAYDVAVADNSKIIMENVNAAMKNINDADYRSFGYTDEEWNGMEDGEKKLAIFDSVGQLVKDGVVPRSAYYKLLYNDLQEEFKSEDFQKNKYQTRELVNQAIVIHDLYENGYLNTDDYKRLVYGTIVPKMEKDKTFSSFVYYSPDYEVYGSDLESAAAIFDEQRIVPNIGVYSQEQQEMMMLLARGYNGKTLKKKKK